MNFDLSDDQRMLKDSVDRFIAESYSPEARASIVRSSPGWSRGIWRSLTELGLMALPFSEAQGGIGLGGVETMIVGEAMGRGLLLEPYLAHTIMAGTALRVAGADCTDVIAAEKLFAVVSGSLTEDGVCANHKLVLGGGIADQLVVIDGTKLAVVAADHPAISRRAFRLHDGSGAAEIVIDRHVADLVNVHEAIAPRVEQAAIAFTAATTFGAAQAAFDLTLEHLKTREQFGKPIGANQALQHRAVEMLVELEALRSMVIYAALMVDDPDDIERARAFAAIKLVANKASRFIGQQAVQLHGGIGVAEGCAVGHYFRHLSVAERLFGTSDHHVAELAARGGFVSGADYWSEA